MLRKSFVVLFFIAGCGSVSNSASEDCYFAAEVIEKNLSSIEIVQLLEDTFIEMFAAHQTGDLTNTPLLRDNAIFFGGVCQDVTEWKDKLAERFRLKKIDESYYDSLYGQQVS